jgi:hypothetical protein
VLDAICFYRLEYPRYSGLHDPAMTVRSVDAESIETRTMSTVKAIWAEAGLDQ